MKNTSDAFNECEALVSAIIEKISGINKSRKKFMLHLFILFMGLRGRYNFLNMARYGEYNEQSYRNNFSEDFDFMKFNMELVKQCCSKHILNTFDPSYIPKSGKKTENMGWFWSGTDGKAKKGLEIGGLAAIDVENNTAMSLEAIPTPSREELQTKGMTLVNHYADIIINRHLDLSQLSAYLVVDGYFAKQNFIHPILEQTSLHIIGKLHTNANLQYLYEGNPTGKKGRPKEFDGKIDVKNIDKQRITFCHECELGEDKSAKVYEAVVYSNILKQKIKIAYVEFWKKEKFTGNYIILFSTDIALSGQRIYEYYGKRYQIEFLFRDGKQHCGLTHCQAQDEKKFHFHVNASLTAVSIAKAIYYLEDNKMVPANKKKGGFSMADIKTLYLNKLIAKIFFSNLAAELSSEKINALYPKILFLGCIKSRAA